MRKFGQKLIFIIIILMLSGILNNFMVSAQNYNIPDSTVFINSRFKLWDYSEKMLDGNFNITIIYYNYSSNNSGYYKIDIDNDIKDGLFKNYVIIDYVINVSKIHYIKIYINNKTIYEVNNIIITNRVSKSTIDYANNQWTINLSPFDWTKKEHNIFSAVITAFLFSLPIVYYVVKNYKKSRGIKSYK